MEGTSKKRRHSDEQEEKDPVNTDDHNKERKNERSIKIDMSKYSPDIQKLTDSELLEIFKIGVVVKQSFTLAVIENNDFVKNQLQSKMKPIVSEVGDMKRQVKEHVTEIQTDLKKSVSSRIISFTKETAELQTGVRDEVAKMKNNLESTVGGLKNDLEGQFGGLKNDLLGQVKGMCQKVEPIRELEDRITKAITSSEIAVLKQLDDYKNVVTQQMQKPAIIGSVGEHMVLNILKQNIVYFTFHDVSKDRDKKGDIHVQTADNFHFLVEVKTYTSNVPKQEIEKFKRDVASSHEVKVGLMFSLKSGIDKKSKQRKFQVDIDNEKFLIYVPNALEQKEVMVWSVLLANELAGMNVELKDGQTEKLQKLCEKFKDKLNDVRKCRERMKELKKVMEDLESDMEPILKVMEDARKEINDIMKTDA